LCFDLHNNLEHRTEKHYNKDSKTDKRKIENQKDKRFVVIVVFQAIKIQKKTIWTKNLNANRNTERKSRKNEGDLGSDIEVSKRMKKVDILKVRTFVVNNMRIA